MDRSRLEAFSDGVMAVAITLLALNLTVAAPGRIRLLHQLGTHWPSYVAYLISFFVIGIIWVNHHVLIKSIKVVDRTLLFLNLVLLLFVVVLPVATGIVADYLSSPAPNAGLNGTDTRVAMALYNAVFLGMSAGFGLIFEWTLHGDRVYTRVPREQHWAARLRFIGGASFYVLGIVVAFVNAVASFVLIGVVAVYYIVERTPTRPQTPGEPGGADSPGDSSPLI